MKSPNPNVTVSTEVAYCPFCRRSRTLRREERHLGGLVRTMISCETCHQTLSTTMDPAPQAAEPVAEAQAEEPETPAPAAEPEPKPAPKPARKKAAVAAKKTPSPTKKPAAKKKA
jgi:cell division septation protein DedD